MELRRSNAAVTAQPTERLVARATLLALTVGALVQAPGRLVSDTKLDLVVAPGRFVAHSFHLWDALGGLGQVPNQAVGYAWPTGLFFTVGQWSPLPMWLVQRLWLALVLCVAALGITRLARTLGLRGPTVPLAGALYALSVNIGGLAGALSATVLPACVAPWVLLPLVRLTPRGDGALAKTASPRRAAAWSALGLACAGGVNATATLAAAILPAAWIATRLTGELRRRTALWWTTLSLGATVWWWGPLLLQSKYGIALDRYTERADITTATATPVDTVRGTHYWLGRLTDLRGQSWIPGANVLADWAPAALGLALIAALGWWGLLRTRHLPARRWWCGAASAGVVVIASGYRGPGGSPLAIAVQALLDGPATPLRNIYKFDVLIRIPLALGIAALGTALPSHFRAGRARLLATTCAVTLLALSATPYLSGKALPDGRFRSISDAWTNTASWLATHSADSDLALVVPAAPFGEFLWGRTLDDPLQPLADSRWATRDIIPLGADAGVGLLDAVQGVLERGEADPGLAPFLARSGVRYLVARHDLDPARAYGPRPAEVHRTLLASGLTVAARFGQPRTRAVDAYRVPERLNNPRLPDIEVFAVPGFTSSSQASAQMPNLLVGDAESLLSAYRLGVGPAQLTTDLADAARSQRDTWGVIASDRPARRAIDGTAARANVSYALGANEQPAGDTSRVEQRSTTTDPTKQVLPDYSGVTFDASSYGSAFTRLPERMPYAAFDGDPSTAWEAVTSGREWIEVRFDQPHELTEIQLTPLLDSPWRGFAPAVEVTTQAGTVRSPIEGSSRPQTVRVAAGRTSFVRVTHVALSATAAVGNEPGWAEISIPGLDFSRSLVSPDYNIHEGEPLTAIATRERQATYASRRADPERSLDRTFASVPAGQPTVTLRARKDLTGGEPVGSQIPRASSTRRGLDPARLGAILTDGDTDTGWVADPADPGPFIDIPTNGQPIDGVSVELADLGAISRVSQIVLVAGTARREIPVDNDSSRQELHFDPLQAEQIRVILVAAHPEQLRNGLALGITELTLHSGNVDVRFALAPELTPTDDPPTIADPCAAGPVVQIGSSTVRFRPADADSLDVTGATQQFRPCEEIADNPAGALRVLADASTGWLVDDIALEWNGGVETGTPMKLDVTTSADRWRAKLPPETTTVAVNSNFSPGWRATLDSVGVAAIRVDGWKQGFAIDPAAGPTASGRSSTVQATFRPQRTMNFALFAGAVGLGITLATAVVPQRKRARTRPQSVARVRGIVGPRRTLAVLGVALVLAVGHPIAAVIFVAAIPWTPKEHGRAERVRTLALSGTIAIVVGALVNQLHLWWDPARSNSLLSALPHLVTWTALGLIAAAAYRTASASDSANQHDPAGDPTLEALARAIEEGPDPR